MPHPVTIFNNIVIDVPREQIYRRLGFRKDKTRLPQAQRQEIETYIEDACSLITLQGAARHMPVREIEPSGKILLDDAIFESRKLAGFLEGCAEVVLMGATAGNDIMAAIQSAAAGDQVTKGVVLDAAASEMADCALDWIMDYFHRGLIRENKTLLKSRFSAGYGDLLLENQKTMYRLLELERIGVKITESCLLVPEKSVTAITGIKTA